MSYLVRKAMSQSHCFIFYTARYFHILSKEIIDRTDHEMEYEIFGQNLIYFKKNNKRKTHIFLVQYLEFRNTFKRNVVDKWEKYAQKQKQYTYLLLSKCYLHMQLTGEKLKILLILDSPGDFSHMDFFSSQVENT